MTAQERILPGAAARVKVLPGGQQFVVEGADTVLEAALRAGLAMPYGCSSGNCGECRARVLAGEWRKARHHDYRLTEAEKRQGYALMCCAAPLGDLVIEASIAHGAADIPAQSLVAEVRRMENLSDAVLLLELLMPRAHRLRYLAGQSARVTLGGHQATLPIASCPCEERRLQFHLRRAPGESFSDHAFGSLRIGEPAGVDGPLGDFVLREENPAALVFIAWGWAAFAPVKSLIEHAMAQETSGPIALYWIAADPSDHYYPKLCRAWAEAMDEFRYAPLAAAAGSAAEPAGAARATLKPVVRTLGSLAGGDFYVAGDAAQVAATCAVLGEHGIARGRIVSWSPH